MISIILLKEGLPRESIVEIGPTRRGKISSQGKAFEIGRPRSIVGPAERKDHPRIEARTRSFVIRKRDSQLPEASEQYL